MKKQQMDGFSWVSSRDALNAAASSPSSICHFLFLLFFAPDSASLHVFIMPGVCLEEPFDLLGDLWSSAWHGDFVSRFVCSVKTQITGPSQIASRTNNSEGRIRKIRANCCWEAVTHGLQWKLVQTLDEDKKYIYCSESNVKKNSAFVSLYLNLRSTCSTLFSYEMFRLML